MLTFSDEIIGLVYEDRVVIIVYLACSKSFEIIFLKILIEKLLKYGLDDQIERDATDRDLDKLKWWAHADLMNTNKAKCTVLHLGCSNPKDGQRLDNEKIESSPEEKDLGLLANKELSMTQQCVLAAQKVNHTMSCDKSNAISRSR
ncbi:hypothetical protein WISP_34567 [Willisornis vidua]|uniref:Rna-directed dna polymerase from mobile element jockey-like n=1 Tax=Willisornis vidua TaxID=1566151 RepID=A0ABQ9DJ27_9PASS|nr:hypothetical protein WISP_34567 [Willisornis vidua]